MNKAQLEMLRSLLDEALSDDHGVESNPNIVEYDVGRETNLTIFRFSTTNVRHILVLDQEGKLIHRVSKQIGHW